LSCTKTAELIKTPFGMLSRVDAGNNVLNGVADALTGRGIFREVYGPLQSMRFWELSKRVSCAKTVGPILAMYTSYDVVLRKVVPFGIATRLLPTPRKSPFWGRE